MRALFRTIYIESQTTAEAHTFPCVIFAFRNELALRPRKKNELSFTKFPRCSRKLLSEGICVTVLFQKAPQLQVIPLFIIR